MGFLKEFRDFAIKGNIIDLAIAVIIGTAFSKIITSLVDNIIMPIVGTLIGTSFSALSATVNGVLIKYGLFLQATVDFLIVAFILFITLKAINRKKKKEVEITAEPSSTDKLLMEIRDSLKNNQREF